MKNDVVIRQRGSIKNEKERKILLVIRLTVHEQWFLKRPRDLLFSGPFIQIYRVVHRGSSSFDLADHRR